MKYLNVFRVLCSSRGTGDRSRDRELDRLARAQMSSQVAEPEEFMPIFDAHVRVIAISSFSPPLPSYPSSSSTSSTSSTSPSSSSFSFIFDFFFDFFFSDFFHSIDTPQPTFFVYHDYCFKRPARTCKSSRTVKTIKSGIDWFELIHHFVTEMNEKISNISYLGNYDFLCAIDALQSTLYIISY